MSQRSVWIKKAWSNSSASFDSWIASHVAWDHALSLLSLYVFFPLEPKKQRSKKKKITPDLRLPPTQTFLRVRHAIIPLPRGIGTHDEPLRTFAWEANWWTELAIPVPKSQELGLISLLHAPEKKRLISCVLSRTNPVQINFRQFWFQKYYR